MLRCVLLLALVLPAVAEPQFVLDCKLVEITRGGMKQLGLKSGPPQVLSWRPSLQFLITQSELKVLAAPRVLFTGGEAAEIRIGKELCLDFFDPRAGEFRPQTLDLGFRLSVLPTLRENSVQLQVSTETCVLTDLISGQYPVVDERSYAGEVTMRDGDTVAISGLFSEASHHGLPLSDLRGDGHAYYNRQPLVVLLTAHQLD